MSSYNSTTLPRLLEPLRPRFLEPGRSRRRKRSEDKGIPRFLLQTHTEIRRKFVELEYLQNDRLLESLMNTEQDSKWRLDDSPEVTSRNRYSNIAAWEYNRIKLKVPSGHCDYINASPITLRSRGDGSIKRYICTQGPKEGQFNHIWQMIWQETNDIAVVVMLTNTFELGRDKCSQYFPKAVDEAWELNGDEFGDGYNVTIKCVEKTKDRHSSCTVRKLILKVGEEGKIVWHLHFKGWPDFNVPMGSDQGALLNAIKLANEKNSDPHNPLIVHDSAGVGRVGVFVTLDHFIREIDAGTIGVGEREDLIFEIVNELREQRMYMVQSQVQFEYLYQVLKEKFQRRGGQGKLASPPGTSVGKIHERASDSGTNSPPLQKVFGSEHPDILDTTYRMAHTLRDQQRYEDSVELYVRVLASREKTLGQEHPLSLDTAHNMAQVLSHLERYEESLELYMRVLASREKTLGHEHPLSLDTAHNAAQALSHLGRYEESLELYMRVLGGREKALGHEHPLSLDTAHNAAQALSHLGRYEESLELYMRVLDGREKALGHEHPLSLDTAHNMGQIFSHLRRYQQALDLYVLVVARRKKILGEDHVDTLSTFHSMAWVLYHLHRYEEAAMLYTKVLASQETTLGKEHPDTKDTAKKMAQTLSCLRQYEKALEFYEVFLPNRDIILEEEDPNILATANSIAKILAHLGRYAEAADLYGKVLLRRRIILGHKHPDTLDTSQGMAFALGCLGRYVEPLELYGEVLAIQEDQLGRDHLNSLSTLQCMASIQERAGSYNEAQLLYAEILVNQKKTLGEEHPDTLDTARKLAAVVSHLDWDDETTLVTSNEATTMFKDSTRTGKVPESHPQTTTQNTMATAARSDLRGEETFRSYQQSQVIQRAPLEALKPNPEESERQSQTQDFDEWVSYNPDKSHGNEDRSNLSIIPSLRRYARRFEDTTWRIKYKISSLEFSVVQRLESLGAGRVFFSSVECKCTCDSRESSHDHLAKRIPGLNQRPNFGGAEPGFGLPDFFAFPTRAFLGSRCPQNFFSFLIEKLPMGLSLLELFLQAILGGDVSPLIGFLTRIASLGSPVSHTPHPTQREPRNPNSPAQVHITPIGRNSQHYPQGGANSKYLPPLGQSPQVVRSRSSPTQVPPTPNSTNHLLLCFNDKFVHFRNLELTPSTTDQQIFVATREEYYRRRGWWRSHLSFERLKRIEFVQFEVYHQDLVAICARNDLPPADNTEYRYLPKPATPPPIPIDCFMFFFFYPEEAPNSDVHLTKIPKKVSALRGPGNGWGIYFIEERSRLRVFILAVFMVIVASVFAIVWTEVKGDIQGGFGVAAFITSVGAIFIAAGWQ